MLIIIIVMPLLLQIQLQTIYLTRQILPAKTFNPTKMAQTQLNLLKLEEIQQIKAILQPTIQIIQVFLLLV
jgi:hypothetical protein